MPEEQVTPVQPQPVVPVGKKPWQSKTLWLALISAALPFFPVANNFVNAHPEGYILVVSSLFAALRSVSHGKISVE